MLKVVTANDLITAVNNLPTNQITIKRPWWWIGSSESYTKRVESEAAFLKSFDQKADQAWQVIKDAAETLKDGAGLIEFVKNNPKIVIVGLVALVLLFKD